MSCRHALHASWAFQNALALGLPHWSSSKEKVDHGFDDALGESWAL